MISLAGVDPADTADRRQALGHRPQVPRLSGSQRRRLLARAAVSARQQNQPPAAATRSATTKKMPTASNRLTKGWCFAIRTDDGVDGSIFETDESTPRRAAQRIETRGRPAGVSGHGRPAVAADGGQPRACVRWPTRAATRRKARPGSTALHRWIEQAEANRSGPGEPAGGGPRLRIRHAGGRPRLDGRIRPPPHDQGIAARAGHRHQRRNGRRCANAAGRAWRCSTNTRPPRRARRRTAAEHRGASARCFRQDIAAARQACGDLLKALAKQPLLYVPLAKGGNPQEIVAVRVRQHAIQDLLAWLPRLGLWVETCELLEVARQMERDHPVGPGAVTEFDELFKIGYRAIVESLVASSAHWPSAQDGEEDETQAEALVSCLEKLTESLLTSWLAHSRTLRLSVLERVHDKASWKKLVEFVERYGGELFYAAVFEPGQHPGDSASGRRPTGCTACRKTRATKPRKSCSTIWPRASRSTNVAEQLALVLESIVENYGEYRDYNSTTTQSDRGELLYMLLDFLRLRTRYDRVCWNLKPVVLAHEILVRRSQDQAARVWRQGPDRANPRRSQSVPDQAGRSAKEIRDANADRRRPPGRAVCPAAGDRPDSGAGRAGDRRGPPQRNRAEIRNAAARYRVLWPASRPASASMCPPGWSPWRKRSSRPCAHPPAAAGRRPGRHHPPDPAHAARGPPAARRLGQPAGVASPPRFSLTRHVSEDAAAIRFVLPLLILTAVNFLVQPWPKRKKSESKH